MNIDARRLHNDVASSTAESPDFTKTSDCNWYDSVGAMACFPLAADLLASNCPSLRYHVLGAPLDLQPVPREYATQEQQFAFNYLRYRTLPDYVNTMEKRTEFETMTRRFYELQRNESEYHLYYKRVFPDPNAPACTLRVLRLDQVDSVVHADHREFGHEGAFERLAGQYRIHLLSALVGRNLPSSSCPCCSALANPVDSGTQDSAPVVNTARKEPEEESICSDDETADDESASSIWGPEKRLYTSARLNAVYTFLRTGVVPAAMLASGMYQKRKAFKQNARRRYKLEENQDTGLWDMYFLRGPESKSRKGKKSIQAKVRSHLYHRRLVPTASEIEAIVLADHRHDGHNSAEDRLLRKYYIENIRKVVQDCIRNCTICETFQCIPKIPTQPIITSRFLQLVMFDLTQYYVPDSEGYQWLLTIVDHFTKYVWIKAFKNKEAEPIAQHLFHLFGKTWPVPERWHADNGGEFVNDYIDAARELLNKGSNLQDKLLPYTHGMPRNPRCQGLVERMNRTVKEAILKACAELGYIPQVHGTWEWRPVAERVVASIVRKKVPMYGVSPYLLVWGRCPDASDAVGLPADLLEQVRSGAHRAQTNKAKGIQDTVSMPPLEKGAHVLVHALSGKRKHTDGEGGRGTVRWPATAWVLSTARTSDTWYRLRWTSDGLGGEAKGSVSVRTWPRWMLKRTAVPEGQDFEEEDAEDLTNGGKAGDSGEASAEEEDSADTPSASGDDDNSDHSAKSDVLDFPVAPKRTPQDPSARFSQELQEAAKTRKRERLKRKRAERCAKASGLSPRQTPKKIKPFPAGGATPKKRRKEAPVLSPKRTPERNKSPRRRSHSTPKRKREVAPAWTPERAPKNQKSPRTGRNASPAKTPKKRKTPSRTGTQATPKKRKTTGAGSRTTPTKTTGVSTPTVPLPEFRIRRNAMKAKQEREKTHEGRLEDTRTAGLKKGSRVVYKCGKSYDYVVTADPVVHDTVKDGIFHAGWRSLMPWAGSLFECHIRYVELFTGTKHTVKSAMVWDKHTSKRFVTWPDEPTPT